MFTKSLFQWLAPCVGIRVSNIPEEQHMHRPGDWLPKDHRVHKQWLEDTIKHVDANPKKLHPVLVEFQDMIEQDARMYLLFSSMFDEIPVKKPYSNDPAGHRQIRDYKHMLHVMNHLLTTSPAWSDREFNAGVVGVPFNAILDWPMGTTSGYSVFLDPKVNAMLKKVLNVWGEYLASTDSAKVLDRSSTGWLGEDGRRDLTETANAAAKTSYKFEDMFHCDPSDKYHGYRSWDDFFTRTFKEEIRPVASPHDDAVVANACESLPYNVTHNVKCRDKFWIKGQPYSVIDMLAQDELAEQFIGGTIYQAYLSALSYHRWHSPVSGKIVKAYVKDGTYYSEPLFTGMADPKHESNPDGEGTGQGYISAVATRGIIFIEADNPDIGLMCVIPVGMVEVSTCEITVKKGQNIEKGDQLGMFHFGGSTHCLLFRKGVKVEGFPQPGRKANIPVRGELARVVKS